MRESYPMSAQLSVTSRKIMKWARARAIQQLVFTFQEKDKVSMRESYPTVSYFEKDHEVSTRKAIQQLGFTLRNEVSVWQLSAFCSYEKDALDPGSRYQKAINLFTTSSELIMLMAHIYSL